MEMKAERDACLDQAIMALMRAEGIQSTTRIRRALHWLRIERAAASRPVALRRAPDEAGLGAIQGMVLAEVRKRAQPLSVLATALHAEGVPRRSVRQAVDRLVERELIRRVERPPFAPVLMLATEGR